MKRLLLILSVLITVTFFIAPGPTYAQGAAWSAACIDETTGVPTLRCIPDVFSNIVSAALMFAGTVAAFLIVYAGIKFVTSGGDMKQVGAARQILTYAIIGLVLVLFSFFIIYAISYLTGADCIENIDFNSC